MHAVFSVLYCSVPFSPLCTRCCQCFTGRWQREGHVCSSQSRCVSLGVSCTYTCHPGDSTSAENTSRIVSASDFTVFTLFLESDKNNSDWTDSYSCKQQLWIQLHQRVMIRIDCSLYPFSEIKIQKPFLGHYLIKCTSMFHLGANMYILGTL